MVSSHQVLYLSCEEEVVYWVGCRCHPHHRFALQGAEVSVSMHFLKSLTYRQACDDKRV